MIEPWRTPESWWPRVVSPGYIFLAPATELVGRTLCGPDWTGLETSTPMGISMFPSSPALATMEQLAAASVLIGEPAGFAARRQASRPRGLFGGNRTQSFWPFVVESDFTADEWGAALAAQHAKVTEANAAITRRLGAQIWIAQEIVSGALPYFLRDPDTGNMLAGDAARWNVDEPIWLRFFNSCEMKEGSGLNERSLRIFVDEAALGRLVHGQPTSSEDPDPSGASTIAQEKRVQSYLVTLMRDAPQRPIPNDLLKNMCIEKVGAISGRAFDRAKGNAVLEAGAPAWRKAGRRGADSRRTNSDI